MRVEKWRHVFKLDPDKTISDGALRAICRSGTDAIIVGGSSGVTFANTAELLARIRRHDVECVLELTSADSAVPGFDGYFIPMVLNAATVEWLCGRQLQAIRDYGELIPWERTAASGYIILNPDATAAKVSGARPLTDAADVLACVRLADRLMRLPVIYLEYSGRYGDMDLVGKATRTVTVSRLFYGGGIDDAAKAALAARSAHTVVVGNVIYEDLNRALSTVEAVRSVGGPQRSSDSEDLKYANNEL
ncbi:heptaprenylglyceryl phosphate synthase [Paenibacillus cisolokensis]|uniref:Heptaprenylglyceryl phosphate synthase n=1 Tax=Paenibacillus cisolokensis TaxID=1658519 RepID=A0ABQ4NFY7_9BACL|nr:heptaprenylglyceryl phosphate synthase [Paenibacillus cisolokensis]GIQ67134.1 heptaprenylglyceryl phosphate synthase [Paenibacillus cisolokensis]